MSCIAVAIGAAVVVGGVAMHNANKNAKKAHALAETNMIRQQGVEASRLQTQREELRKAEKQKDIYRQFEFKNPYENVQNVYEDMTVNQQQAQFEKEQFQQQQANIMQGLQGAAGGSGVGAMAQALSASAQQQAQRASISIGQQERANQQMRLTEARNIDMMFRAGEASVEEKEMSRQSTLLGVQMGQLQGANAAAMQASQNVNMAAAAQANMYGQQAAGQMQMAGSMIGGAMGMASDRKLKKNINKIGESPSGLNIYSFEFKDSKFGKGIFQGVMSDEVPQEAVINNGVYDKVNYNMLDVEFKQI